jgi:uncharacterized membrane-anchored protein
MREMRALIVVLIVQVGILVAIPARKIVARATGQTVTLETRPVDPYDILAGYYVTLAYAVERADSDLVEGDLEEGQTVFVNVEKDEPAWRLRSITSEPDTYDGAVSIRATWKGSVARIEEASRFYVPEDRRHEIDGLLRAGRAYVDLKVDAGGAPAVLRLRVQGRVFGPE